jgi:hypothetical protein
MTKSWKTTVSSGLAALGYWASLQPDPWWLHKVGEAAVVLGLALTGATARDNSVPSEAVKSASKTAERIKGETNFIQKEPPGK